MNDCKQCKTDGVFCENSCRGFEPKDNYKRPLEQCTLEELATISPDEYANDSLAYELQKRILRFLKG